MHPFWHQIKELRVFCRFNVIGETKFPIDLQGNKGIGANASLQALGTFEQIKDLDHDFLGISLMRPIMVGEMFLVCLDFDWKRSPTGMAEPEQLELMTYLIGSGCAYETSWSGKGCHIWALMAEKQIPKSVKLPNNCEIEVFSGFEGQRSNVLITDYDFEGKLQPFVVNMPKGLEPPKEKKEVIPPTITSVSPDVIAMLDLIPSDDYQTWIQVGMILKSEHGEDGYDVWDLWSKKSDSYDPFVMGTKWESFKGQGLTKGSLIKIARDYGYEGPTHEKTSASEDFPVDPETGEIMKDLPFSLKARHLEMPEGMEAPVWVVDGIIPTGVGVIAGSAGVGKTTAIVPVAVTVAGFQSHLSNVSVKMRRKVIYITEDDAQVFRVLFGIQKWLQTQNGGRIDRKDLSEWFHVYNSKRLTPDQLKYVLLEAHRDFMTTFGEIPSPPLVVLDTAAANIDLDNENDNALISKNMAILKEVHASTRMPIWIVAHLTKTAKGIDVDNLDTLSARGGGAWEADANWTAILSTEKETETRIMKMNKRRVELQYGEIEFDSAVHEEFVKDQFGDMVGVSYRYSIPRRSDVKQRIAKGFEEKENKLLEAITHLDYPSKNELIEATRLNKNVALKMIDDLVDKGRLELIPLPENVKKKGRTTYYAVIPVDTTKRDFG